MEKVKELIKQEFEANDEKVVQIVKDPPLPKKVLPLFRIPLKGEPKAISISSDSIFIGLQTGFPIFNYLKLYFYFKAKFRLFLCHRNKNNVLGKPMISELKESRFQSTMKWW